MKADERMIVSILVQNQPGALIRAINVFSRRGINISSLNVEGTEDPTVSRIMLVTESGLGESDRIRKMLEKIYDAREVELIEPAGSLEKRRMLVRSKGTADGVRGLKTGSLLVEIIGDSERLDAFVDSMKPYGMIDMYAGDKRLN